MNRYEHRQFEDFFGRQIDYTALTCGTTLSLPGAHLFLIQVDTNTGASATSLELADGDTPVRNIRIASGIGTREILFGGRYVKFDSVNFSRPFSDSHDIFLTIFYRKFD